MESVVNFPRPAIDKLMMIVDSLVTFMDARMTESSFDELIEVANDKIGQTLCDGIPYASQGAMLEEMNPFIQEAAYATATLAMLARR